MMQQILSEEVFSTPQWQKITYGILSLITGILGGNMLMIKDPGWVVFLAPIVFLIAVSMFIYIQLKLIISNNGILFTGGLKRHSFLWNDITKIDMGRFGKYKTPIATIYYSGGKLDLKMSFYSKLKFSRILTLLEMKADPGLFTEEYQQIRSQIG